MMRNWNRREFTRNVTLVTLFSPFIRLLEPSVARAQAGGGPAKYLLIFTSNGTDPAIWQPLGGSGAGNVNLPPALDTLEPVKNDVILLNDFNSKGTATGHGSPGGLSGAEYTNTQSLDFFVADELRSRGTLTQVPSLHLGGMPAQQGIGFRNNALQVPQFSVSDAFRSVFDGVATAPPPPPAAGAPVATGPSETEMRLLRRRSILDVVTADIAQLEGAFAGLEREKLQRHIESIRLLETRIGQQLAGAQGQTATPVAGGAPTPTFVAPVACNQPNLPGGLQPIENSATHVELATTAMACDITRVAHIEFGHHQSCPIDLPGAQGDWHNDFMHASQDRTDLINTERFVAQQFANAITRLKQTPAPDGNGTLYDQTFMLWVREMGDAVLHNGNSMPFVVAGRAGGYLRAGNGFLTGGQTAHLRVLLTAAEAMGIVNPANFGKPDLQGEDRQVVAGLKA